MKSDVEELMPRLLPVEGGASAREDLDFGGTPRNPQEYLRQVQYVHSRIVPPVRRIRYPILTTIYSTVVYFPDLLSGSVHEIRSYF